MTKAADKPKGSANIPCVVMMNGMMFINCTKDTIDRAVENENRRRAYLGIGEWGEWEDNP